MSKRLLRTSSLCLILAGSTLTGCGILDPDEWADRREALERSRERWADELARTYRYTFSKSCECIPGFTGPVVIDVTNDEITALTPLSEDVEVPEEQWRAFDTVVAMFELIETAIDERAHSFDVEYDPSLGYPTGISLDFDEQGIDDELLIRVTELEIVERWATLE